MNEGPIDWLNETEIGFEQQQPGQIGKLSVSFFVRLQVYLPLFHRNGHLISWERIEQALLELHQFAGTLTVFPPGLGQWLAKTSDAHMETFVLIEATITKPDATIWVADWTKKIAALLETDGIFTHQQEVWLFSPAE